MQSRMAARRITLLSRTAGRQSVSKHVGVRYNASMPGASSSTSTSTSQQLLSPFVAAAIGGGVVLAGGYAYYHFSGIRDVVQSAQSVHSTIKSARDAALEKPNEVIQFLRITAKAYVLFIPGLSGLIDASFDLIDQLEKTHRAEVSAIVNKTYADLQEAVKDGKVDAPTGQKVFEIFKRQFAELAEVAKKAANEVLQPVLEQHPELREWLGGRWTEIQQTYQSLSQTDVSQQAQRIYSDTSAQLVGLFQSGVSATSLTEAKALLDEKSQQISELELYEKGEEEYLKDAPDQLKKFFSDEETVKNLLSGGGGTAAITAVWNKVKEVEGRGKWDDKSVQEVQDFVRQKMEEARKKGGSQGEADRSSAQGWLKGVPGVEQALQTAKGIDISSLSQIATTKSGEAKKLVEKTYSDGLSVLKGKSEGA
ncbi:hypothetical protein FRC01_000817 [Tulasnella sp. 417]|nr:hypothetical protein FRC01_000817 [Tulasnella sp. 417]